MVDYVVSHYGLTMRRARRLMKASSEPIYLEQFQHKPEASPITEQQLTPSVSHARETD